MITIFRLSRKIDMNPGLITGGNRNDNMTSVHVGTHVNLPWSHPEIVLGKPGADIAGVYLLEIPAVPGIVRGIATDDVDDHRDGFSVYTAGVPLTTGGHDEAVIISRR